MKTFNKHVKWRKDKNWIFICDCKRLIDFKLPLIQEQFMKKLDGGVEEKTLTKEEKMVFDDFKKMKMLSNLKIARLTEKNFKEPIRILDNELGIKKVRNAKFLHDKFKEFPQFFMGIFHDKELVGLICGFPRDDYLLMSEIAIDSRFHGRGYGENLVREFEKKAYKYKKIHAGAEDNAIGFYKQVGYKPFLLIQV